MEADKIYINLNEPDLQLIKSLMKHSGLPVEDIAFALRYNVLTTEALAKITKRSNSAIQNLMRPRQTDKGIITTLRKVYPLYKGPVCILLDQSCMDYIISTLKPVNK